MDDQSKNDEDGKHQVENEKNSNFDEESDDELNRSHNEEDDDEPKEVIEPPKSADFMAMVEDEMEFMNEEWTWPEDKPEDDDNDGDDDDADDDDANEEVYIKHKNELYVIFTTWCI